MKMRFEDLRDKFFLVTGASSGIGRAIAVALSQNDARVALCGRDETRLAETLSIMTKGTHTVIRTDLQDMDKIEAWMGTLLKDHGPLNGIVHSAGFTERFPLQYASVERLHEMMTVNLYSFVEIMRNYARRKYRTEKGSVVAISSISAAFPFKSLMMYGSSKAALDMAVKVMALELTGKVRVNSVRLAGVDTPGTRRELGMEADDTDMAAGDLLSAHEAATLCLYLLSDASRGINGMNIPMNNEWIL
jgi:NAD(P)-dependent dehydrogenase (short-subunit alcohol dehydrogenase family)